MVIKAPSGDRAEFGSNGGRLQRVAVLGAGLAGLTAAKALGEARLLTTVFEKSRGVGGRLASRRPFGRDAACVLDHGAPAAEPEDDASAAALAALGTPWPAMGARLRQADAPTAPAVIAPEGASALVKPLAAAPGVTVVLETEITAVARGADDFLLWAAGAEAPLGPFDAVVSAVPAPQAAALLGGAAPETAFAAEMRPVLAMLAVFAEPIAPADAPPIRRSATEPLELIVRDSAKPGRTTACAGPHGPGDAWVAHAGLEWSERLLEAEKDEIAAQMLPLFGAALGVAPPRPVYLAGHRWRYAYATRPTGQAFWISEDGRLGVCGDWRLGATAGAAWRSGDALGARMARALTSGG